VVKGAECTERGGEGVHNEYCWIVVASDGLNEGLEMPPWVRGRNWEVDAMVSELLRRRPPDSKSRRRASRQDILPSSICFLLLGFLSVYLHSSRFDRAQGVQTGFEPSHFWMRIH